MKINSCPFCGQYHSDYECEAVERGFDTKSEPKKFKDEKDYFGSRKKNKFSRRPPNDKSLKWEYTK